MMPSLRSNSPLGRTVRPLSERTSPELIRFVGLGHFDAVRPLAVENQISRNGAANKSM